MDELIPSFKNTIFDQSLVDAGTDVLEIGIDSIIDDPFFNSFPITRFVIGVGKTALNISERHFLKNTYRFLVAFNTGSVDEKMYSEYKQKIESDPKKAEEELGRVMIILNRSIESKKAEILGKFFQAYVNQSVSWEEFSDFSDALDRIFISDLSLLYRASLEDVIKPDDRDMYKGERLNAIGLVNTKTDYTETTVGIIKIEWVIQITDFGKRFIQYGLT